MINILIVEDEFAIALDIEQRLQKLGYNSVGIASSYNEASSLLLENNNIDIALLDINLGVGKSGIDLGKMIKEKFNIPIIFLTAYSDDKTFEEAENANPYGYIIKPFNDNDIDRTIKIALQRFKEALNNNQQKNEPQNNKNVDILFVKDRNNLIKVNICDILWLEAMDNYTIIYTIDNKFIVNQFLKDVLTKLDANKFARIHRSYAVALNKISSIEDNTLYINNKNLNISRKYKKDLLDKIHLF